jgi:hypothetical protein
MSDKSSPTVGWLRSKSYQQKYELGQTTLWKLKKSGAVEVRNIGGLVYIRDRLPEEVKPSD